MLGTVMGAAAAVKWWGTPRAMSDIACFVAGTLVWTPDGTVPIERLHVGDRVQTTDDSVSASTGDELQVIKLSMPNPDGTPEALDIELLRSAEWIAYHGATAGSTIDFALPEMGLQGPARVVQVDECPTIKQGRGRLVLATVTHLNGDVFQLRLADVPEVLEPTGRHPLFSEDRQTWVRAGELREGERLRTLNGPIEVVSITRKSGVHRVYNLEVQTEHTYFVSKISVLVHNVSGCAEPNPGSYTNTHESGTRYHGKGTPERAARSASEKAAANGDPLANTDWTPAESERAAFKQEAERIAKDGGPGLPHNYNKINSPGKKYLNEDCKK